MATEKLSTVDQATKDIEVVLEQCNAAALREMPVLRQAVILATGVTQIRRCLTDDIMRSVFMPLQGSALGFVTDKDRDGGYDLPTVRNVVVEALIHGFYPVGNEINIIAGRMYGAKNGFARKVREFEGLSDLIITPGVPVMKDGGAIVPMRATWMVSGKPYTMIRDVTKTADGTVHDSRIPVKVNSGMGVDAVIGKATRKMLKSIYDMLSGSVLTIEDGEVGEVITAEGVSVNTEASPAPTDPEQDGRRIKLGNPTAQAQAQPVVEREPGQEG